MGEDAFNVVGREDEIASLEMWLAESTGLPAALLLAGDAGIGKTVLWRRGMEVAHAASFQVLSASPTEAESHLSFAGLSDLLEPVVDEVLIALHGPLRRSLAVALLREEMEGGSHDQRAVAMAFLEAVRTLSARGPLAIAVDDIQWLDEPSFFTLSFAMRRLRRERVAILCGMRTGDGRSSAVAEAFPDSWTRRLTLGPMGLDDMYRLLSDGIQLALSRPRLRRLHALSEGNPFYALELGRAVMRGMVRLDAGEMLPRPLASLVDDRLAALPDSARLPLIAASVLSHPTVMLVTSMLGDEAHAGLTAAQEHHVIERDRHRLRFTHPLLASAVYAAADDANRTFIHQRAAGVVGDGEERAHHLALAAAGPDSVVADALDAAARHADLRGALASAADLADAARRLTPTDQPDGLLLRTIRAAGYAFDLGDIARGRGLIGEALAAAPAGRRRAEALYWLGRSHHYEGDRRRALALYREALSEADDDQSLQVRLHDGIADALLLLRMDLSTAADHAGSAVDLAERIADPSALVESLGAQGLIDALAGGSDWRAILTRAVVLAGEEDVIRLGTPASANHEVPATSTSQGRSSTWDGSSSGTWLFPSYASFNFAVALTWADEFDEALAILRQLRHQIEERAEESALPWTLAQLGLAEYLSGRWPAASRLAEAAHELAAQVGQESQRLFALGVRALVHASQGDVDDARADAVAVMEPAEQRGVMIALILASSAVALLELSLGRAEAAHRIVGPLLARLEAGGVREPGSMRFIGDDIEALIGLGRLDESETILDRLEQRAWDLNRVSAIAVAARCRGLLLAARGDTDAALDSLHLALAHHDQVRMPFERGRTLLALGRVRRRAKMKRAARDALEESSGLFGALGARIWADTSVAELGRVGGRGPATGELTPTERRIAELVADGHTDREVATVLYVTPKTVSTQLSRIYRKVGVHSRTSLAARLRSNSGERKV